MSNDTHSTEQDPESMDFNWIWLTLAALLVGVATIMVLYYLPMFVSQVKQDRHEDQINTAILEANYCQEDSDCVIAETSMCPFGCYITVNEAEVENIQNMLEEYQQTPYRSQCVYSCIAIENVVCENNRCTTVLE